MGKQIKAWVGPEMGPNWFQFYIIQAFMHVSLCCVGYIACIDYCVELILLEQ